ncbi:hypothetical protein COCNU_02G019420 [Cocos nucifera]|uniref:Subtilisin-like protease SBT2.6 n=1 Tax=Cocos nucifera TaxID=13894 RepID=A0A8K0I1I0_COCNU|nr:hypothetical protein COCNU_02G019420 [Cocos nucifera]
MKMEKMELWCMLFVFLPLLVTGSGDIYIVTMEGEPIVSYGGGVKGFAPTAADSVEEMDITSEAVTSYALHLEKQHDALLDSLFEVGTYKKLYSYRHLINGFSIHISSEQAEALSRAPGVKYVEKDMKVKKLTTHTPQFLGLPTGVWPTGGGFDRAGEDIVIGFVDSGIYPKHPSFSTYNSEPYGPLPRYRGKCEIDPDTKRDFCNGKIIGAQHFAKAAIAAGAFNPTIDFASPLDGDGHGSHTAAIAAGNNGIPVRMHGHEFGKASGMAPRARIAVYKVLYRLFGGYVSDVVAAIEQAVQDGVDILNLSVGPNSPPSSIKTTFLNPFDAALLSAVKAGVFVAQAAGNGEALSRAPGVKYVEKDMKVKKLTTHTPQFLGLPTGVWPTGGGFDRAGEDIVIGFVDSGIYPKHPSFSTYNSEPYGPLPRYRGKCEIDPDTKRDFCNGKIIGAQHFAKAAIAAGAFNPTIDFASPLDGDGHGSHTAAIAAGNNGIPVRMHGHEFGKASGMAPRARIAVYKVLYRLFGGYVSDVVAAIEQAVQDGVDILNLSVGPNSPPSSIKTTFLNPFDAALLSAVKAGVFVAQAAGNGAATHGNKSFDLVSANDVLLDSSIMKYNPLDCQRPELLNKKMVEGRILLCGYSFNFVSGTASIKKVSETAKSLGAAGFIVAVESSYPGTKFDPVPVGVPGILISDVSKTKVPNVLMPLI